MKLKKFAILLLALLVMAAFAGSALAGTRIDTDAASLEAANKSEAASGQSGTVDGVISFDYNGKTYVYYHMNDGGSGYFLPVTYMQEALDAAFSLDTPSEAVQGYQKALESAMSAFLGKSPTDTSVPETTDTSASSGVAPGDNPNEVWGNGSSSGSSSTSGSGSDYAEDKDDPYGALKNSGSNKSNKKSGSTPELGDESAPLYVLIAVAALSMAGMLYARKRSMEA